MQTIHDYNAEEPNSAVEYLKTLVNELPKEQKPPLVVHVVNVANYENPWNFEGGFLCEVPKGASGFVYMITNLTNDRKYIGKKSFWSKRKDKKTKRRKTKESDWKTYYSSSDELKFDVRSTGKENFKREILYISRYAKAITFIEVKEQFVRRVLETKEYYNTNILGKFFSSDRDDGGIEISYQNIVWKKKITEAASRRTGDNNPARRPEVRAKLSKMMSGENNPQYGKTITAEHKKALHDAAHKARRKPAWYKEVLYESGTALRKSLNMNIKQFYKLVNNGAIVYDR